MPLLQEKQRRHETLSQSPVDMIESARIDAPSPTDMPVLPQERGISAGNPIRA
jgi:hypothetical protein